MINQIEDLRAQIDDLNLALLELLNARAKIAEEIGTLQTAKGLSHYDPVREQKMLDILMTANKGPFTNNTLKSLFKQIFQASMQLEDDQDKAKYLASRSVQSKDTVVRIGETAVGGTNAPVLIAGPCAIESHEQVFATAEKVSSKGIKLFRGGAFKPRTDPYSFQGLGLEALKLARAACDEFDLKFVTEVMDARDLPQILDHADVLQIGARNMQNFSLLKAVGATQRPVLFKRGLSATIEEWIRAAEYLLDAGNPNVILCERGIRTFERYTRNTLDVSAVALAKIETHLPVLVDVTHSGGRRDLLVPLTKSALAIGADGIMIEVHPNPTVALSDNKQQIDFDAFDDYLEKTGYHRRLDTKRSHEYGF